MTSLIRNLLGRRRGQAGGQVDGTSDSTSSPSKSDGEQQFVELDSSPEKPYIVCSLYYLAVVIFIGIPMWFYTCSATRYSLPNLSKLESKFHDQTYPRLHLDISVVQLAATSPQETTLKQEQSDFLRANLPNYLETSIESVTYNVNWRIRRPTADEDHILKSLMRESEIQTNSSKEIRHDFLLRLEQNLLKIHKSSNRFRLFIFLFDEPLRSLVCDAPRTYLIGYERFVYLCPGEGNESLANLIQKAVDEVYRDTVDITRVKKILSGKTDLLMSLVSENQQLDPLGKLAQLADKIHQVYDKNVKNKYLELAEVLNIRLITQDMIDLLDNKTLDSMLIKNTPSRKTTTDQDNSTSNDGQENNSVPRIVKTDEIGRFYYKFESRFNKHSSQSVHHILTVVPDNNRPQLIFNQALNNSVQLLEERDSNFIFIADSDKSIALGFRAIIRRIIGLSSANLCNNCLLRRDVFINSWELDSIVGALTITKIHSVLLSLQSIGQQAIGVKIPKYVSTMAYESHRLVMLSMDKLETKVPLEAYRLVNSAHELSESAYYDPSLLEALYFPDETKYAIYIPLFLPLLSPFVMSILRTFKYLTRARSPSSEKIKTN